MKGTFSLIQKIWKHPQGRVGLIIAAVLVLSALLALTISVGAVFLFQQGTFLIGGERAAILSTVEPITSLFIGTLAFREVIGTRTAVGSVLVIAAGTLIALFDLHRAKQAV